MQCTRCAYVGKCEKGLCEVTGEKNWRTWNPRMHGDTDKEAQVWRGSPGLSFQPRSLLHGHLCFRFPIFNVLSLVAIMTMHCTVHMSVAWRRRVVRWACATYQYHMNGTDTVGRWGDACGPVDHASVGLAQSHPNNTDIQQYHMFGMRYGVDITANSMYPGLLFLTGKKSCGPNKYVANVVAFNTIQMVC